MDDQVKPESVIGMSQNMHRYFEGVGDVESNAIDCLDSARLRLGNMLQ